MDGKKKKGNFSRSGGMPKGKMPKPKMTGPDMSKQMRKMHPSTKRK
jgi:hypothetical protein